MAATTITWNTTGNTYVHAQLGDDFNGTGEANRPFRSLYRACVKGGTIVAAGIFSELVVYGSNLSINADSFGAAIFDGARLTGVGGAVNNHSGVAGNDSEGFVIYNHYIYNFIYLRSRVPVGFVGVGGPGGIDGFSVGGGSLLVDSFTTQGNGNGHHCAFIYPKFNAKTTGNAYEISNLQRLSPYNASYGYTHRQTFVGVRNNWSRTLTWTRNYNVFDDCTMPVIFNNNNIITFDHCAFRNTTFIIPASLSKDNTEHTITTNAIALAVEADPTKDCNTILSEWMAQYASTSYKTNVFSVCICLKDSDPLFNNLNCVWRDATSGEVVTAANSANAYIDPELSSFDISISDQSPALPYLSAYSSNWRGAPATLFKMEQASTLVTDESASGDIQLAGNLKFEIDSATGKKYITWAKDFDDPTLVDDFKGGTIITRPRKIPSAQLFKYPMISGQWASAFIGEMARSGALMGRNIKLGGTTVQFDDNTPVALDNDRLWLKNSPATNEVIAGYRYLLTKGYVNLYNSSTMSYIEYTPGSVICTTAGDTYFLRRLYDGDMHPVEYPELIELLPNENLAYNYANRMEIRLFNNKTDADAYNTDSDKLEVGWIPIQAITGILTGIHYYDLPQNDFVFSPTDGYLITQNPNINKTTQTLAVHAQHTDERHDAYMGDNMSEYPQGVYTKTTNANRARYPFSPLSNSDIYVQLRMKVIPFTYEG